MSCILRIYRFLRLLLDVIGLQMENQRPAFAAIRCGRLQLMVYLYAMLGSLAEAMQLTLLTFIGPAAQTDLNLTVRKQNWISIATYTAMVLAAYFWSSVADSRGRT
ncbi:organic cation/carnitine transporter 7, partial [Tanacetum coccineum]